MKSLLQWKWAIAGLAMIALLFSSEGSRTYWKRKKFLKELERKLAQSQESNKNLSAEIRRIQNDPRAIEQIARKELGLIQPGEIEYRFVVQYSTDGDKSE